MRIKPDPDQMPSLAGAYVVPSAEVPSRTAEPRYDAGPPPEPTAADKALVAALRARQAG